MGEGLGLRREELKVVEKVAKTWKKQKTQNAAGARPRGLGQNSSMVLSNNLEYKPSLDSIYTGCSYRYPYFIKMVVFFLK